MKQNLLFNRASAFGMRFIMVLTMLLIVGIGQMWGATASYTWDLTSSSANWTSSGCETYFSQPYGMKKANAYIINKSIDDFKKYAATATSIQIGVKSLCNGATTSKLTVYLVDKDGNTIGSGLVITPDNKSSATNTTYKYVTFTSNLATATGYKIQCTTFGKNVLVNGSSYEITYDDSSSGGGSDGCTWQLVTDASTLVAGDRIVIAAKDYNYAISTTQNSNNRGQAAITKSGSTISEPSNSVQILTLEAGKTSGYLAFNTGSGYLYAASSGSNYLRTETNLSNNSSWSITIAADGTATLKAQGTNTRNVMQYNQSSSIFACYSSASQKALVIYKAVCITETTLCLLHDKNSICSNHYK